MADKILSTLAIFVLGHSPMQLMIALVGAIVGCVILAMLWVIIEEWWL